MPNPVSLLDELRTQYEAARKSTHAHADVEDQANANVGNVLPPNREAADTPTPSPGAAFHSR